MPSRYAVLVYDAKTRCCTLYVQEHLSKGTTTAGHWSRLLWGLNHLAEEGWQVITSFKHDDIRTAFLLEKRDEHTAPAIEARSRRRR